ncbi:hypothetical protein NHX12_032177, partial [Muraenolepis orangiensis]
MACMFSIVALTNKKKKEQSDYRHTATNTHWKASETSADPSASNYESGVVDPPLASGNTDPGGWTTRARLTLTPIQEVGPPGHDSHPDPHPQLIQLVNRPEE